MNQFIIHMYIWRSIYKVYIHNYDTLKVQWLLLQDMKVRESISARNTQFIKEVRSTQFDITNDAVQANITNLVIDIISRGLQ